MYVQTKIHKIHQPLTYHIQSKVAIKTNEQTQIIIQIQFLLQPKTMTQTHPSVAMMRRPRTTESITTNNYQIQIIIQIQIQIQILLSTKNINSTHA